MKLDKLRKKLRRELAAFEIDIHTAERKWNMRRDAMDGMDLTVILANNEQLEREKHELRERFVDNIVAFVGKD